RGIDLIYGGGHVGLMGIAADAAIAEGGRVIGVITEQLHRLEIAHQGLTSLEIVASMHQRKARMAALSEGFLVLPGGFGTLDEMAEMLTWNQLGVISKPVVLVDIDGFWGPLYQWIEGAVEAGFVRTSHRMLVQRATTVEDAIAMAVAPPPDVGHKWVDRDFTSITGSIPVIPTSADE
ncbi:MAG TPA: TIGR00730 family Rossman fold protein, partial [Ilumatobacteraceae bacterium]|nr:TIGR00730 family Rossman fold protein [Ilumatobacteraceae bacterium]